MARTKQCARKTPKGARPDGDFGKVNNKKPTKTSGNSRKYTVTTADGGKHNVSKSSEPTRDHKIFFQAKKTEEPALVSLVHAVNNSVGLPLVSVEEMCAARAELQEAAGDMGLELYLGTDHTGEGDWPIEVVQHALYQKLTPENITFTKVKFGMKEDGTIKLLTVLQAIDNHAQQWDLLVELQFPTDSVSSTGGSDVSSSGGTSSSIDTSSAGGVDRGNAGYHYSELSVGKNNERGHFVAVRNGVVYDSASSTTSTGVRGLKVHNYKYFAYTKNVYRVVVNSVISGVGTSSMDSAITGTTGNSTDGTATGDVDGEGSVHSEVPDEGGEGVDEVNEEDDVEGSGGDEH